MHTRLDFILIYYFCEIYEIAGYTINVWGCTEISPS